MRRLLLFLALVGLTINPVLYAGSRGGGGHSSGSHKSSGGSKKSGTSTKSKGSKKSKDSSGDGEKTVAFGAKILELCIEVGGTITGEHGVGVEKIDQMCAQFASAEIERFHAIKHAFDAKGLLNPGKAVPTLHRCAEMGRMVVHRGRLPFPDLPRF